MQAPSKYVYIGVGLIWCGLIAAGLLGLADYSSTPGASAAPQKSWPAASSLIRPVNSYSLLMFVHPHCPCSQASLGEINRLIAKCGGKLAVKVVFVRPAGMSGNWEKTDLWRSALEIPGVQVVLDDKGVEAALFDATTSGQTFLYSPDGTLVFSGGITAGRGHSGDNAGADAVASLVSGKTTAVTHTPVFGCQLSEPSSQRKAICPQ